MESTSKFCENCGAGLADEIRFCEACGHEVNKMVEPAVVSSFSRTVAKPSTACPKCQRDGISASAYLEKSAKRSDDVADESTVDKDTELSRDEIIDYLARPEAPETLAISPWIILLFIPFLNIISVFFAPIVKGLKFIMSLMNLVFIGFILWYATGTFDDPFQAKNTTFLVGSVWLAIYIGSLLFSKWISGTTLPSRSEEHKKTIDKWQHLYFCERCQEVYFDDIPQHSAPIEETEEFLNGRTA